MKKATKFLPISIVAILAFFGCRKPSNNNLSATDITLSAPKVSGNLVTLTWTKLNNDSLLSYQIIRVTDTSTNQYSVYQTVDKNTTQFTDTLPLSPYVQYYIIGQLSVTGPRTIISNKQVFARTDINFVHLAPMDALLDRTTHQLYIYSANGAIAIYDLQTKKSTRQIATDATIGYCALGTFNGVKELYVPRNDGWLFIYNATTLEQIDQINVGGQVTSVVYNDGKLFVCGPASSTKNLVSYDRASKTVISTDPVNNNTHIKLFAGTNSELLSITSYNQFNDIKFDATGKYVSQNIAYLSGGNASPDLFEIFPDGTKFITSSSGSVFNDSLKYVVTLPHGTISFTSFDFDNANNLIYAGCSTKTIQAYSTDNYQLKKTITTLGYPSKVFYDNGSVISVSVSYLYPLSYPITAPYVFVEQF